MNFFVHFLRRYRQVFMILITIAIIISFTWFYQGTSYANRNRGAALEIYGEPLAAEQLEFQRRRVSVFAAMGNGYFEAMNTQQNMFQREQKPDPFDSPVINSIVFEREAKKLGLAATDEEIKTMILEKTQRFQDADGKLDPASFDLFTEQVLGPNGYSKGSLEDFARSAVQVEKMKQVLAGTIDPTPEEVRSLYQEANQKTQASYFKLKLTDFLAGVTVTKEEAQARYDQTKETLKTDEKRKVRFVAFKIPNQDKPLEGPERVAILQPLVNAAAGFAETARKTKFEDAAKAMSLTIAETPEFTAASAPPELDGNPDAASAAFALTKEKPLSDVIDTDKGAYVLELSAVIEPQTRTFDEAKVQIEATLREEKARQEMNKKMAEVRTKIEAALNEGKSFADAATAAGVKAETVPEFSRMEPPKDIGPDSNALMSLVSPMPVKKLSNASPVQEGTIIAYVENRPALDEEKFLLEKKITIERIREGRTRLLFQAWLKDCRNKSGVKQATM